MSAVVVAPETLTPDRLTEILRREGTLETGHVEAVATCANPAFNSAICHLTVTYSADAPRHAPTALLLKRSLEAEWARAAGRDEVAFYTAARAARDALPMIVPCYDAVYDPITGDSHLLLLDVSASHSAPATRDELIALRAVPPRSQLEAVITALAGFHAHWWDHPSLVDGLRDVSGWYGTRDRFDMHVERRRREWDVFLTGAGRELPPELLVLYRHLLDRLPGLWERGLGKRVTSGRNRTLVHGDCYLSQFLCPKHGGGTPYLVDWQGAWIDLPTIDLTHILATFWTPEQRHEEDRERRLLQRYLEILQVAGVNHYDWNQLCFDYRLLLIFMALCPIWDAANGSSKDYWWPKMCCLTASYRDWACAELLG